DQAVRLADPTTGGEGEPQAPAGVSAAAALPSLGAGREGLWYLRKRKSPSRRDRRRRRWWRSGPMAAASRTPVLADGRPSCGSAASRKNWPAPIRPPPTTAW